MKPTTPTIGRKVLKSLRSNNLEVLIASRDQYGGDSYIKKLLEKERYEKKTEGKIAALPGESPFSSSSQIKDDSLQKEDMYVNLADNSPQEVEKNCKYAWKMQLKNVCRRKKRGG